MADSKLSALAQATSATGTDELYVNDGGVSKRIIITDFLANIADPIITTGIVRQDATASGDIAYFKTTANSGTGLFINSNTANQIDVVGWDGSGANAVNIRSAGSPGDGIVLDTSNNVTLSGTLSAGAGSTLGTSAGNSVALYLPESNYIAWYDSGTAGGTAAYVRGVGGDLHLAGNAIYTDANVAVDFGTGTLSAGATTVSSLTNSGDVAFTATTTNINPNTSDGTDNARIFLTGGGTAASSRGAHIGVYGNEYSGGEGRLLLAAGNDAAHGDINLQTAGSDTLTLTYEGNATFAGSVYVNGSSGGNSAELAVDQSASTATIGTATLMLNNSNVTAGSASTILFQSTEDSAGSNRRAVIEGGYDGGVNGGKLVFSTRNTDGSSWNDGVLVLDDDANATFAGTVSTSYTGTNAVKNVMTLTDAVGAGVGTTYQHRIQLAGVGKTFDIGMTDTTTSHFGGTAGAFVSANYGLLLNSNASGADVVIRAGGSGTAQNVMTASGTDQSATFAGLVDISGASAGQIKFPATQNASADANTLDDYEEGTFTPTLDFTSGSTGLTTSASNGYYTKIGDLVRVFFRVTFTAKGSSSGGLRITNLPFTIKNDDGNYGAGEVITNCSGFSGLESMPMCAPEINNTILTFTHANAASGSITGSTPITDAECTDTTQFYGAFTYRAA